MGRADLRLPLLGATAWAGALVGTAVPGGLAVAAVAAVAAVGGVLVVLWAVRHRAAATAAGLLLVLAAATAVTAVRQAQVADNPVSALAAEQATVTVVGTATSDPRVVAGGFGPRVVWRLEVRAVSGRGEVTELAVPVLVVAGADSPRVPLGSTIRLRGRLAPAKGRDLAALLVAVGDPEVVAGADPWWRGAAAVRQSLRESVAHRSPDQRALVPALVVGDDTALDSSLEHDFRTTGLSHLLAVSGTNLTLVVGFLLVVARWACVRGRWLYVVGAAGVVGFVLLARTEPSVLRAAVMGTIALVGMGVNGQQRGLRALGLAVLVLVIVAPRLATAAGFALSVLATAGILVLAPGLRDALARWLPRWLAEAVAIPTAAQLACTPVVAAISGEVSLVAVAANLLAAPVVGPATVLGLAGGLAGLLWDPLGRLLGTLASWCVAWLVVVAERGAALPLPAIGWGTGPLALAGLTALVIVVAVLAPRVLGRPLTGLGCSLLLVVAVLVRPGAAWPPDGWAVVACDVGQGDALALRAGPGSAVVVDAGPEPAAVDRCLERLGVVTVPLLVLTHFHLDHVGGVAGVLAGREVSGVLTTGLRDPPGGVAAVAEAAGAAGLVPEPAAYGSVVRYGEVALQVLWPQPGSPTSGPGDGSTANDASVVLLAEVAGIRVLLTGDLEPEAQGTVARTLPGLRVDVLKMPHHGSRHQDERWLTSLGADVVLVCVGADNDYGHPADAALEPLADSGAEVGRTDLDGALAIVAGEDGPRLVTHGS